MRRRNPFEKADHVLSRTAGSLGHPVLDRTLITLSRAADRSLLWLGVAAVMAVAGGRFGRRAALRGVLSVGVTSALVNGPLKLLAGRRRPPHPPPRTRALRRTHPSGSFPSGHSASAFAFATAVALEKPALALPLGAAAAAVAASRVHAGVHHPTDVLAGSAVGAAVALGSTRLWPVAPHEPAQTLPGLARVETDPFPEGRGITFVVNSAAGPALHPDRAREP
ncbi:MAG TPA: phosphatase PAP2 family protein, partial [Actinomycetota bacterium]|nr:phosphatase PAP2 family protein [Actinomycetota bacterium]